ncbi:hypothetical protein LZ30DRAFT_591156 [Colletotrichum cereale]|nr:hypothetical protein LZ30DRAFT_591156 [Colletotrichum cereale]
MRAELLTNSVIKGEKVYVCCPMRVILSDYPLVTTRPVTVSASTSLEIPCARYAARILSTNSSPISLFCGPLCNAVSAIIASVGRPEVIRPADLGLIMPWATCSCYHFPVTRVRCSS